MYSPKTIQKSIAIHAPVTKVWDTLTKSELIKKWLSDEETIEVVSDWKVGSPISFEGKWHTGTVYKDKGVILQLVPEKVFKYTYWSEISALPDSPENYTIIEFTLQAEQKGTHLTLTQTNCAAGTIYEHWNFYWTGTLHVIKRLIEKT